ncbi:MAG TPA: hypothetical protein PKE63_01145 [Lacibacter sp.]|nr:hypothetical protein [Lacibacter sp.]HMO90134.1 hypothetical protein [Lacibacter sp.]HMP85847.1 hypothetical protein [Lacibacter sp.]
MDEIKIIDFKFSLEDGSFSLILNLWILLASIVLFLIIRWINKRYLKSNVVQNEIIPVKLKYSVGGAEIEYDIIRNYQNVEIAYKILIELITRKAAIKIDKEQDVIVEVYNSWYSLFQITREELKKISGEMLLKNNTSEQLVKLLSDILNEGLRPHLTKYQAKFRKWYNEELTKVENKELSPQEIQKKYTDFGSLTDSMVEVNELLIDYSNQLQQIIKGTKKNGA